MPVQLAAKSIHQRNKSSPALSSLAHAQATKPPLTRAAFADVSNTARPLQTIKDDSVLNHKPVPHVLKDKPLQDVTNANAAALQKPAQRPLSVSGLKGFFSNLSTAQLPSHAPKPQHSIESFAKPPQPTAANKPVTKKSTAVLRDPVVQSTDVDKAAKQDHLTRTEPHPETVEHTAAEGKEANSTAEKLAPSPKDTKIKLAEPAIPEEVFDPGLDGVPLPKEDPAPSALNQLYDYRSHDQLYEDALQDPVASYRADGVPARELHDRKSAKHDKLIQQLDTAGIVPQSYVDEAYLGPYYEEGYTTARSLKSRGECTTGSTTVLLAPQTTTEAERELVAARQYVLESAETTELEEDEAWDTSMVAEYGDEIFSYMRCLEVRNFVQQQRKAKYSQTIRNVCAPILATWTTRPKSSGRCVLSSWIGLSKSTIVSRSFRRPCSSASIILTAFSPAKSSHLASYNWLVPRRSSLRPSMKRSIALQSKRSCTWLMAVTTSMRSLRQSDSC